MTTIFDIVNNIADMSFIAGTRKLLTFSCFQEDGVNPLNIQTGTVYWRLCPYGEFGINILNIAGELVAPSGSPPFDIQYKFTVTIPSSSTISLNGKYIQQVNITDFFGHTFIPGQGIVLIAPAIVSS